NRVNIILHFLFADKSGELLIIRHSTVFKGLSHSKILIPIFIPSLHPIPFYNKLFIIGYCGLQAYQRIHNLKSRSRSIALSTSLFIIIMGNFFVVIINFETTFYTIFVENSLPFFMFFDTYIHTTAPCNSQKKGNLEKMLIHQKLFWGKITAFTFEKSNGSQ